MWLSRPLWRRDGSGCKVACTTIRAHCRWQGMDLNRKLSNGNILHRVDELNWLGKVVIDRSLPPGIKSHHDAMELPNGNIVALVDNPDATFIDWKRRGASQFQRSHARTGRRHVAGRQRLGSTGVSGC